MQAKIHLSPALFDGGETLLAEHGGLVAYAFRYASGVPAIKLSNPLGEVTLLPYHGQQVWRASFCEHDLTMRTMFEEPTGSRDFLMNYGGFLLHCGLTGIGHEPLQSGRLHHGELPNAHYQRASLLVGEDEKGKYLALTGTAEYKVSFTMGYRFEPELRLYERESLFTERVTIENLRAASLPYVYLCHVNFRPVDGARLVYSASAGPGDYMVHSADATPELKAFADKLRRDLKSADFVNREAQCYDPEICVTMKYHGDKDGYAHTMQLLPDGCAHYVAHPVEALPIPVRWIARTPGEDAMGMVLPATSEHLGFENALQKGQVKYLEPHGQTSFALKIGLLTNEQSCRVESKIHDILREANAL